MMEPQVTATRVRSVSFIPPKFVVELAIGERWFAVFVENAPLTLGSRMEAEAFERLMRKRYGVEGQS